MEHQDQNLATDKVLAFDTIFTTNHIKMLKVLLFFLDSPLQKMLAVYIKFLELQYVFTYFDTHSSSGLRGLDFNLLFKEIIPYCNPSERKKIEHFSQMQQMMEQFQQINQTMEMMKEMFPDGIPGFDFNPGTDSNSGSNNSGPFQQDILSSLFGGGENSQMFEMLAAMMNPTDISPSEKYD